MTPDELDAIEKRWRNASDPLRDDAPALHAALRQAWAVLDAALVVQDDLVRQRDLAQITMAEDAGRRIMDLTAEVEWQAEVIVDARDACQRAESIEPVGSPEWVESGIAMRTTVLREVRAILDRERNAHPFGLSTPSAVAGNRELAERAEQAEAAIARVRAALDAYDRKHPIFADATHYAAVETDLRERIAREIEAAHRTAPDCCAYDVAARIARGQS